MEIRSEPKISVVTVVWNNLEGLRQTAANVQAQQYANIQHVVVDGASSDGTPEWLRAYAPRFETRKLSEPDDGLYQAMNKGLDMATGDLVVFLNGGDTFTDDRVLSYVANQWAEGSWLWGYGGINYIDADRHKLSSFNLVPFQRRKVQLGLSYVPHPATFMSRNLLLELEGFRPEFGWSADQELGVRAALRSAPVVWARPLTDFLVGGAHSQGSLGDVAKRYSKIRTENGLAVCRSETIDSLFTSLVARYWSARAWASARFKSRKGIDVTRSS
ncbi:glycosyltransferase family 2 protein [Pseudarthrobacter chlorophenolicus]|uniref:glycosyltransferase family 2 protein n=1 Tax=Pseudarthrobacter chlorophenolicus TaxID=85085 RepID=UPI0009E547A2